VNARGDPKTADATSTMPRPQSQVSIANAIPIAPYAAAEDSIAVGM
jgi:hypothetical protein